MCQCAHKSKKRKKECRNDAVYRIRFILSGRKVELCAPHFHEMTRTRLPLFDYEVISDA